MYESIDTCQPHREARKKPGIGCMIGLSFIAALSLACPAKIGFDILTEQSSSVQIGDYKAFIGYIPHIFGSESTASWRMSIQDVNPCSNGKTQENFWVLDRYTNNPRMDGKIEIEVGPIACTHPRLPIISLPTPKPFVTTTSTP